MVVTACQHAFTAALPQNIYDFCGPAALVKTAKAGPRSSCLETDVWMLYLKTWNDDDFDSAVGQRFLDALVKTQMAYVSRMEIAAQRGDGKSFAWHSKTFLDFFQNMCAGPYVKKDWTSIERILSYEYALSRVVLDRSDKALRITPETCRGALPAEMFNSSAEIDAKKNLSALYARARTFRNALIVGCAIERHLSDKKTLPPDMASLEGLLDEEKKDSEGRPFVYRHEGDFWSLTSGEGDQTSMKAYLPAIGVQGMPDSIPLVFASDYTQRRRELFVSGTLEVMDGLSVWVVGRGDLFMSASKPDTASSFPEYDNSAPASGMPIHYAQSNKGVFNALGVEALLRHGNPFEEGVMTNSASAMPVDKFLTVPFEELKSSMTEAVLKEAANSIYLPLVQAEAAALAGDRELFSRNIEIAGTILKWSADEKSICLSTAFWPNLLSIEYLLTRIICDRRTTTIKVSAEDVRRILPESITLARSVRTFNGPLEVGAEVSHNLSMTFRNMLVVGAAIEEHLRKTGKLPGKLGELSGISEKELLDVYDAPLEYRTKGPDWELFSPGFWKYDKSLDGVDFGLGVPVIGTISGPRTDSVWFSSLYHKKRTELFEKGIVNEGTKFQCKLAPSTIVRGVRD